MNLSYFVFLSRPELGWRTTEKISMSSLKYISVKGFCKSNSLEIHFFQTFYFDTFLKNRFILSIIRNGKTKISTA